MTTIPVVMIQNDIDDGLPNDPLNCPIAQTMRRIGAESVEVCSLTMEFYWPATRTTYTILLPSTARKFIKRYDDDNGEPVNPITFELPLPT